MSGVIEVVEEEEVEEEEVVVRAGDVTYKENSLNINHLLHNLHMCMYACMHIRMLILKKCRVKQKKRKKENIH